MNKTLSLVLLLKNPTKQRTMGNLKDLYNYALQQN